MEIMREGTSRSHDGIVFEGEGIQRKGDGEGVGRLRHIDQVRLVKGILAEVGVGIKLVHSGASINGWDVRRKVCWAFPSLECRIGQENSHNNSYNKKKEEQSGYGKGIGSSRIKLVHTTVIVQKPFFILTYPSLIYACLAMMPRDVTKFILDPFLMAGNGNGLGYERLGRTRASLLVDWDSRDSGVS